MLGIQENVSDVTVQMRRSSNRKTHTSENGSATGIFNFEQIGLFAPFQRSNETTFEWNPDKNGQERDIKVEPGE